MGERTLFNFAYPNLYLVTTAGETVLLTHGHYFEAYWTLLGEWAMRIAGEDLPLEHSGEVSIRELVGLNFPLHQLACSGVGQARPLTALARRLQLDLIGGDTARVDRYLRHVVMLLSNDAGSDPRVEKEAQAGLDREAPGLAEAVDRLAFDVFEHQVGLRHLRHSGVGELGEDPKFAALGVVEPADFDAADGVADRP